MRVNRSSLYFARSLKADSTQRRIYVSAIHALIRSRRFYLRFAAIPLIILPRLRSRKIQLWRFIAALLLGIRYARYLPSQGLTALLSTHAYQNASERIRDGLVSPFARSSDYREILQRLREYSPRRLLLFHHYDSRGRVPLSWIEFLSVCRESGWYVIFSTSYVCQEDECSLVRNGINVVRRVNHGRCLGSYKDTLFLIGVDPAVLAGIGSIVLCNDSTVPVLGPDRLLDQMHRWTESFENAERSVLAGLTDCAQRSAYHLQSYFLYANAHLLCSPAWARFWLGFRPTDSKDQLINEGEIALSQTLLHHGVQLQAAYPIVRTLLALASASRELRRQGLDNVMDVNQALSLWQTLLGVGFPLVKKQLLFDDFHQRPRLMALTRLSSWIPLERRTMLFEDIHELFVSRLCNPGS